MAVYGQPLMLAEWFRCYREAEDVPMHTQVLVVDDCGTPPATVPISPEVRLLRITKDTPWNQGEARNLAACEARGRVLLMLDPDMTLPPKSLQGFIEAAARLPLGRVVRPVLRHANGELDTTSPNVYLIHRADFLAIKGYDLAYAGHKCWGDVELYHVMHGMFKNRTTSGLVLDFHHSGNIKDAQVMTLDRTATHNRKVYMKRLVRRKKIGNRAFLEEHSPMVKSPWVEIR
jgi:hypothetical protein